ncbi:hypothetical protein SAMN05660666_00323 [Novosphingobium aromaticivorans]|nr:hypothetical protein [Novosphingobium aromaticivorans]SCX93618.1 hypothetical protein SAMN05660666_00323 [Novosphingobium aromaticivorans]
MTKPGHAVAPGAREGVDRPRRRQQEIASGSVERLSVEREVDRAFNDEIALVPVVVVWRRASTKRQVIDHDREPAVGIFLLADEADPGTEHLQGGCIRCANVEDGAFDHSIH